MKGIDNAFIAFLIWVGLMYLAFVISNAQFNPFLWDYFARTMFALFGIIFGLIIAVFDIIDKNMKL